MPTGPSELAPYVGPRPFDASDSGLFFGREHEADQLLGFLVSNPIVLFYALSGCGKTSLLNARLIPRLQQEEQLVLPIARVSGVLPDAVQCDEVNNVFLFNALLSLSGEDADVRALSGVSLSDFIRHKAALPHASDADALKILLFDQFEELFTRHLDRWQDRRGFFEELAALVANDPLTRILFAIREDHLAQLEPYTDAVPGRLRARYRIEPLREDTALLAVRGPLETTRRRFDVGVAEKLVEELLQQRVENERGEAIRARGEFVEPVQLQVVCRNLWEKLPADTTVITEEHRQRYADVDEALSTFYEHAIAAAATAVEVHPRDLREWCQNALITVTGTRSFAHRGPEETAGLSNNAVDILEAEHLIRPERRAGATWYELMHDRLIAAVQESNEKWQAECNEKGKEALSYLQDFVSRWGKSGGRRDDVLELAQKALGIYEVIGDLQGIYLACNYLGAALADQERYEEALQYDNRALHLALALELQSEALQCALSIVDNLGRGGRYQAAIDFLDRIIESYPESWSAYAQRGDMYFASSRYREAISDYAAALRLNPNDAPLVHVIGVCHHHLRQHKQAEKTLTRALQLDPKRVTAHVDLAGVYVDMGKLEQAEGMYLQALKVSPRNVSVLCALGDLHLRLGQLGLARADYKKAIDIDPASAAAYNGLGWALNLFGEYEASISCFLRALDLVPGSSGALYGLGDVFQRGGRYIDAINTNERYLRFVPDDVLVYASIGVCYKKLSDDQTYAEKISMALSNLTPEWESRQSEYNRACFYAMCGRAEVALRLLAAALRKRELTRETAWADIDFEMLWEDPRFIKLVGPPPPVRQPPDAQ